MTGKGNRPILTTRLGRSELSFDRRLIDYRPYSFDFFVVKTVEYVLGERNSLSIDREAKELPLWRAVESKPARYVWRLADEQLNIETKIRDFLKISLEHLPIESGREAPLPGSAVKSS